MPVDTSIQSILQRCPKLSSFSKKQGGGGKKFISHVTTCTCVEFIFSGRGKNKLALAASRCPATSCVEIIFSVIFSKRGKKGKNNLAGAPQAVC